MKFNKKHAVNELAAVVLMGNESCSNSSCRGNNFNCTSTNNTSGCGCR